MDYTNKLVNSLKIIIITYLLQYIIIIISCLLYIIISKNDLKNFINTTLPLLLIIYLTLITLYLTKRNKIAEAKINYKIIPLLISIGISTSCLLNMIIFKIFNIPKKNNNIYFPILLISSCIIGPIYEEIIFRYIHLKKLKKFNNLSISILINSIIFAIIHLSISKIIFAFFLSIIINIIYKKYNNIVYPILIHSSANFISLFLKEYSKSILYLSIICLLINIYIIYLNKEKSKNIN